MSEITINLELLVVTLAGIAIPAITGLIFALKGYINNVKDKVKLQAQLDRLKRHDTASNEVHDKHETELADLNIAITKLSEQMRLQESWIKLVLKKLDIDYPK